MLVAYTPTIHLILNFKSIPNCHVWWRRIVFFAKLQGPGYNYGCASHDDQPSRRTYLLHTETYHRKEEGIILGGLELFDGRDKSISRVFGSR